MLACLRLQHLILLNNVLFVVFLGVENTLTLEKSQNG